MNLADYLLAKNIRRTDFAEMIGVSQSYVTQLCQGQIWPGRDIASKIIEATNGDVTPNDFIRETGSAPVSESTGEAA